MRYIECVRRILAPDNFLRPGSISEQREHLLRKSKWFSICYHSPYGNLNQLFHRGYQNLLPPRVVWVRITSISPWVLILDLRLMDVQRCGLTGGSMSPGESFGISKNSRFWVHSVPPPCKSTCELSTLPCTMPWLCHHGLQSPEMVTPIKFFLFKLPWSWHFEILMER